ncbi:Kinase, CMGC CDK [Spironucleus salmonicida]|uniref:mitogen-activated protein kinase kinase n=1 Tax=Spironucleus salmonicida TaxID=348837 RepID=V6LSA7_9EUKA|nr:Kinase, CMGC CDK [Spironucleus salmonicida]|eukprot:EST47547.1 Kinase, CMGC CDK [Spironucleus salmonicida]
MYNKSFLQRYKKLPISSRSGGQGSVFDAIDLKTDAVVVVKKLHFQNELPQSAVCERHVLSLCTSPFIVQLIGFYSNQNSILFVLEKCDSDLQNVILSPEMRVTVLYQLTQAILYIHSLQIAHRDVKPANLLIKDGNLKLCDFGLSGRGIKSGGTRGFVPPETMLGGDISVVGAQDIWAIGITAICLLMGVENMFQTLNDKVDITDSIIINTLEQLLGTPPKYIFDEQKVEVYTKKNLSPQIQQFLQENSASAQEIEFIKMCLIWNPSERPKAQELYSFFKGIVEVPIVPITKEKNVKDLQIVLDQDEAPLAGFVLDDESEALAASALDWSMSDLFE